MRLFHPALQEMIMRAAFSLRLVAGLALVTLTLPAGLAGAQTAHFLTVNTTADSPTVCGATGPCSLRGAVTYANNHPADITNVAVRAGTYDLSSPLTITLDQGGKLNLNGASQTRTIVTSGCNLCGNHKDVIINSGSVSMRSMSVEGGDAPVEGNLAGNGGAIDQEGGTLSLSSVTLSGNMANDHGGALYLAPTGQDTLTAVKIDNNYASNGGGIFLDTGGLTVTNGEMGHNFACAPMTGPSGMPMCMPAGQGMEGLYYGGAIFNYGATLTITNTTIDNNTAEANGFGGGIENEGSIDINRSVLTGNAAYYQDCGGVGGGMDDRESSPPSVSEITNTTIKANFAGNLGGGVFEGMSLTLSNDRIINNQAGGLESGGTQASEVRKQVLEDAVNGAGGGIYGAGNVIGSGSVVPDSITTGLTHITDTASYISGNVAVQSDNTIGGTDSDCASRGGGLYLTGYAIGSFSQTRLISNAANCGGGSYQIPDQFITPVPQLTFSNNSELYQNKAADDGGAMYLADEICNNDTYLTLFNTRAVDNTAGAANGGGGLYDQGTGGYQISGYGGITGNHPNNITTAGGCFG
ncbi:MAG: CSLREA domain-containing protein [Chloroflexota bacterium]